MPHKILVLNWNRKFDSLGLASLLKFFLADVTFKCKQRGNLVTFDPHINFAVCCNINTRTVPVLGKVKFLALLHLHRKLAIRRTSIAVYNVVERPLVIGWQKIPLSIWTRNEMELQWFSNFYATIYLLWASFPRASKLNLRV